jgi:protein-L-isoaspartate O-methyltransferase
MMDNNIETYDTKYGKISLYKNEHYIGDFFKNGKYWDEDELLKLKKIIPKNKNILEIGGHCGTSSIVYASFLDEGYKVFVLEPQKKMFCDLKKNYKKYKNGYTVMSGFGDGFYGYSIGKLDNKIVKIIVNFMI